MCASAATYSPDAQALGYKLDTSCYKNIGWVSEFNKMSYITDESGNKRLCGTLYTQTLYATNKSKYLSSNQLDVWLTRTITEPTSTKYTGFAGFLGLKKEITVKFSTRQVIEDEAMPSNIKLASYMATSPSQVITKSITSGWKINAGASISYKDVEIGGVSGDVEWSSSSDVMLCEAYNSSRTNRFKVAFTLLDPYDNTMSNKQRSYCYGTNYYYTAKAVYGTPANMKKYLAPSNTTAYFVGHYMAVSLTENYPVKLTSSANISFSAMIGG